MQFLSRKNRENNSDMQLKQVNDLYFQHDLYFQRLFSDFTMSKRIYHSKFQKIGLPVALDEFEGHEKISRAFQTMKCLSLLLMKALD